MFFFRESKVLNDFEITNHLSQRVTKDDFKNHWSLIFVGYTHCPDICPTSLAALSQALDQLPEDERSTVQGLFISVDPERDTPSVAAQYAQAFHPQITGLSGDKAAVTEVAKRFFVLFEKVELEDSAMDYAVDHSSILYIIGKDGVVKELVRHSQSQEELVKALRSALNT